jgi:peptidoglycan hydrolase-like protein with peptidoglycan-binding domain
VEGSGRLENNLDIKMILKDHKLPKLQSTISNGLLLETDNVFDNAEAAIEVTKVHIDDAQGLLKKIASRAENTKEILDSSVVQGDITISGAALLGSVRKHSNKGVKKLRLVGDILLVAKELIELVGFISKGLPVDKLIHKWISKGIFEGYMVILTMILGGSLGGRLVRRQLAPLGDELSSEINRIKRELDGAYEATYWLRQIKVDPAYLSLRGGGLSDELKGGIGKLQRSKQREMGVDIAAALRNRESIGSGGSAGTASLTFLPSPRSSIRYDRGKRETNAVKIIQRGLAKLGAWDGGETGRFDKSFRRALRSYQKKSRIKVDGAYGSNTKKAMKSDLERMAESVTGEYKMKITRKQLQELIYEEVENLTYKIKKSTAEDALSYGHPSEVKTQEDTFAGGANIVTNVDHLKSGGSSEKSVIGIERLKIQEGSKTLSRAEIRNLINSI